MFFSEEQIIASAPDIASMKAGKDLAIPDKWLNLFFNARVMWGEVQGSGKELYRTQIDLTGKSDNISSVHFKCTCPSRKFPCKHGLGLMFLYSKNPEILIENNNEPNWVKDRMDKRAEKALKPMEISQIGQADEADEKNASEKRLQKEKNDNQRFEVVKNGVEESTGILKDFMRLGLLTMPEKGKDFFLKTAARMVDAKAAGLANRWRAFAEVNFTGNDWHEEVMAQIADLYLLSEAFRTVFSGGRLSGVGSETNKLSSGVYGLLAEDIKTAIGFTTDKKELTENASAEKIKEGWLILSSVTTREEDLMIRKNWLFGLSSHRFAFILEFKHKTQAFENFFSPESVLEAELVFFPSAVPQRAIINSDIVQRILTEEKNIQVQLLNACDASALNTWRKSQKHFVEQISKLPWLTEVPQCLANVSLTRNEKDEWFIKDAENIAVPIVKTFSKDKIMKLSAITGDEKLAFLFLLRASSRISPLGGIKNEKYFYL